MKATLAVDGVEVYGPVTDSFQSILTPEALMFVATLARQFEARRQELLARRLKVQKAIDGGSLPDFSDVLPPWIDAAGVAGRWIVAGLAAYKYIDDGDDTSDDVTTLEDQVALTRSLNGFGTIPFSISDFRGEPSAWDYYLANIFATPVSAPSPADYPWRSTEGIVLGHIFESDGVTPVTDAWISRGGTDWTALSSADGLYAFLRVPAGVYTVSAEHPDHGDAKVRDVIVSEGGIVEIDLILNRVPVGLVLEGQP